MAQGLIRDLVRYTLSPDPYTLSLRLGQLTQQNLRRAAGKAQVGRALAPGNTIAQGLIRDLVRYTLCPDPYTLSLRLGQLTQQNLCLVRQGVSAVQIVLI